MRVNGDRLLDVAAGLSTVHSDFSNAEKLSKDWGGVVGDRGLADVLDDFSGNWDYTRDNMLDGIKAMSEAAKGMADVWEDLESWSIASRC